VARRRGCGCRGCLCRGCRGCLCRGLHGVHHRHVIHGILDAVGSCGDVEFDCASIGCASIGCASIGCASIGCASIGCASIGCASIGCASIGCASIGCGSGGCGSGGCGSGGCASGGCGSIGGGGRLLLESSREEVHEMQEFLTAKAASERQSFRRCMASVLRGNEPDVGRSSCCRGASVASGRVLLDDCRSNGLRRGFLGLFHLVFDIIGADLAHLVLDDDISSVRSSRDGGGSRRRRRDECRSGGGGTTTSSDGRSRLAHSA
jgi:hypothetical protein